MSGIIPHLKRGFALKFSEICEGIKAGTIVLDMAGHKTNATKEEFLADYAKIVAYAAGANDGKWNLDTGRKISMEETNATMRKHYQRILDREIKQEKDSENAYECSTMGLGFFASEINCFGCGQHFHWTLTDNVLRLGCCWNGEDHVINPVDFVCEFKENKPYRGKIKINSKMIFANFFHLKDDEDNPQFCDAPDGKKYTNEYSLNNKRGRVNIAKYKEANNIAYGQMSNMSVGIYLSPDCKSIIVGDPYVADRIMDNLPEDEYKALTKRDKAKLALIEGHKMIGRISTDVWRWEATDLTTLGERHYKTIKETFKDHNPVVVLDVPHGEWQFEHFYDSDSDSEEDSPIYSRFTLISEDGQ